MSAFPRNTDYREQSDFEVQITNPLPLSPNSQKKKEKMLQTPLLKLRSLFPLSLHPAVPQTGCPKVRHCLSVLVFLVLLLLDEVTESIGKTGKSETVKNLVCFLSGNGDFFHYNFFASQGKISVASASRQHASEE